MILKRGDIYLADLDPVVGSEQGGLRPVLIIQNDIGNRYSPTCIVAAVTSRCNKKFWLPTHVLLHCTQFDKESVVLLEQIRTIDRRRLGMHIGQVEKRDLVEIDEALIKSLGIRIGDEANERSEK